MKAFFMTYISVHLGMKILLLLLTFTLLINCTNPKEDDPTKELYSIELVVLGIAQDAGFPQAGCEKENCQLFWDGKVEARHATSLGLIDHNTNQYWIFEATPDFKYQLHEIQKLANTTDNPSGIFLTHAHIGHYTGIMHLGHEVMGASNVPVYAMPRMKSYLEDNGPWSQLVSKSNISIKSLTHDSTINLKSSISVTPFLVPHRDEYSETVGYKIKNASKTVLFIPDINKWDIWERSIIEEIASVDYAFIDATFYNQNELPGRDISKIPHPFVEESMDLFKNLASSEKAKVYFIHFNHTNPLILDSPQRKLVKKLGYNVAFEGMRINLDS
jgi:pyrroloquinoline quinone biosynthesis protein B